MGSTGACLSTGGFKEYGWEETGSMYGVKVLKKKTKGKEKQSLPPFSNTPGRHTSNSIQTAILSSSASMGKIVA